MDREALSAVRKLIACAAVAIALLLISLFGGDSWVRPIAIVSLIVVAAPVTLLVSIDVGRVLRRQRLGRAASIATRLPQFLLGAIATIVGVGGTGLALLGNFATLWQRVGCAIASICVVLYGASLLRANSASAKGNVSS